MSIAPIAISLTQPETERKASMNKITSAKIAAANVCMIMSAPAREHFHGLKHDENHVGQRNWRAGHRDNAQNKRRLGLKSPQIDHMSDAAEIKPL
jgi:hypothetical protein